jgi:hypothetical protein
VHAMWTEVNPLLPQSYYELVEVLYSSLGCCRRTKEQRTNFYLVGAWRVGVSYVGSYSLEQPHNLKCVMSACPMELPWRPNTVQLYMLQCMLLARLLESINRSQCFMKLHSGRISLRKCEQSPP